MTRGRVKTYSVYDMVSLSLGQSGHLTAEVQENLRIVPKKYIFHTVEEAARFHHYLEYIRDCGGILREIFLDMFPFPVGPNALITNNLVVRTLQSEDIQVSPSLLDRMMLVPDLDGDGSINYSEWFHIFLGTPLYSKRQCLMEWIRKAGEEGVSIPGTRDHQMSINNQQKEQIRLTQKNEKMVKLYILEYITYSKMF